MAMRLKETLEEFERAGVIAALVATGGNINQTAQLCGYERTTVHAKLVKWGIDAEVFRFPLGKKEKREDPLRYAGKMLKGNLLEHETLKLIVQTLEDNNWNRTRTAKALGISVRCLRYKILVAKDFGLEVLPNPAPLATAGRKRKL